MSRGKRKTPDAVTLGFESDCVTVPVEAVLPLRALGASVKSSRKYRQITASIKEVGLVEPPVVTRSPGNEDTYMLLDGHIRIEVLKDLGIGRVECLISTDDEAFTYNKRISRLAPIQEHKMIRKAIERGVSEEKIALALDLNPRSILRKARLLDGICEEAVGILKDKHCATAVFETPAQDESHAPDRGGRADDERKQLFSQRTSPRSLQERPRRSWWTPRNPRR